jgi:hypothetical protein
MFQVLKVEKCQSSGKLSVHTDKGTVLDSVDQLIWAIGRDPLTPELNLPAVGVEMTNKGHIKVDEFQNTTRSGIYAIGDVATDKYELTPGDHLLFKILHNTQWFTFFSCNCCRTSLVPSPFQRGDRKPPSLRVHPNRGVQPSAFGHNRSYRK